MKIETKQSILDFGKTISGCYSNKLQAQNNPKDFANINIYFIPIAWSILNAPGLYSEQVYNHLPWSPYRQALHTIDFTNGIFRLKNYRIMNKERIAGSGLNKTLLTELSKDKIVEREFCGMDFKHIKKDYYIGSIQAGKNCILSRNGKSSYLVSNVELRGDSFISEDSGIDIETDQKIWGSDNGPFIFQKTISYKTEINEEWIIGP
tara:strand:+ start:155 stop:772 length:618 start_codon:yes stop_codon:yes gene_type:complete